MRVFRTDFLAIGRFTARKGTKGAYEVVRCVCMGHQSNPDSARDRKVGEYPQRGGSIGYKKGNHPTPRFARIRSSAFRARIGMGTPFRPVASWLTSSHSPLRNLNVGANCASERPKALLTASRS